MSKFGPKHVRLLVVAIACVLYGATSAAASTITFNFNGLSGGNNNATIQSNMNTTLGANGSVVVTGATANKTYNGDNHVVGPTSGTWCWLIPSTCTVTSLTLGNTEGGDPGAAGSWDTFLFTQAPTTEITMLFSGLTISSVSFDYQIFPDATCTSGTSGSHCPNGAPDFTFKANGATLLHSFGVVPTTSDVPAFLHSPDSGGGNNETAAQLGPAHVSFSGLNATYLEFMDWPATIGIDNLVITTTDNRQPTERGSRTGDAEPPWSWPGRSRGGSSSRPQAAIADSGAPLSRATGLTAGRPSFLY